MSEQYSDASYSVFVESESNRLLYEGYYHHSFLEGMRGIVARHAKGDGKGDREALGLKKFKLLDVGCGNAVLSRKVMREFSHVVCTGVDLSRPMLHAAALLCSAEGASERISLHEANVLGGTSESEPLVLSHMAGSFDCAISGFVLAHLATEKDLQRFFSFIAKSLKAGGSTIHINVAPDMMDEEKLADGHVERVELPLLDSASGPERATDAARESCPVIELFDVHWKEETLRRAAESAGLVDFCYDPAQVKPNCPLEISSIPTRLFILKASKPGS